ncbi:MAG: NTP transferase domain-containing protein [Candidatus Atribacteria bacterium]|nr:NTP transferase domain-containing protein [Candidatus Atribacteria bacterium]
MELSKYTININASLMDVLKKIDQLTTVQTVFVIDNENKVVGTITDGDIRRGLIRGLNLENTILDFLYKDFQFILQGKNNFDKLKVFREKKLKAVPLLTEDRKLVKIIDFTTAKSILPIDALIMAGGEGKRLLPLTKDVPKPLLKIGGKEIIAYNFDRLLQYGITRQYVSVKYLSKQIIDFCEDYDENINFRIIKEKKFLGTAGALSLIDDFYNDTVLLMNSDILTNIDYEDFYKTFLEKDADIMVASIPYHVNLPYAIFDSDDRNVKAFKEKPSYIYYANAGIYLLKRNILNMIPSDQFYDATDLMEQVIKLGKKLIHYPIQTYWMDIGKHEDFEKAQKDIAHIKW